MSKNVIIGIYDYGNAPVKSYKGGIYAFLKSLRQHNTDCEVVIVCHKNNESKILMKTLNEYNAYTYNYDPKSITQECNGGREFKLYCKSPWVHPTYSHVAYLRPSVIPFPQPKFFSMFINLI